MSFNGIIPTRCIHQVDLHDTCADCKALADAKRRPRPAATTFPTFSAPSEPVGRGARNFGGATSNQVKFIRDLIEKRDLMGTRFSTPGYDPSQISSREASFAIDDLKALPYAKRTTESGQAKLQDLEDGMYLRLEGDTARIFKVYHTVHGANQQVAKELIKLPGSDAYFEYKGKGPLHDLTPANRMTLDQAKHYSAVYGVCIRCGATLTAEVSIERAMGPVCVTKI